jgi:lipopolysaccharide export system permease protein
MLKIIQRYTIREIAAPALLGLLVFTFVLLTAQLFRLVDLLINRGVTLPHLLGLLGSLMPIILPLTVPMALLVGVLLGFGRLAGENEIIALRASGANLWLICWPVLTVALLVSVTLMSLNLDFFPSLSRKSKDLLEDIQFDILSSLKPGEYDDYLPGITFSFDGRDEQNPENLKGLALNLRKLPAVDKLQNKDINDQDQKTVFITAQEGIIEKQVRQRNIALVLKNGQIYISDPLAPTAMIITDFGKITQEFQPKFLKKIEERKQAPSDLSMRALIAKLREDAPPPEKKLKDWERPGAFVVEFFTRLSTPFACLAFTLFGIPLAIKVRPRGKAASYGFTIAIVFFYYIVLKYGESLGYANSNLTGLVILAPNILLLLAGAIMMRRTI